MDDINRPYSIPDFLDMLCYKWGLFPLDGPIKERWMQLCERAANEKDPAKVLELVQEINRLLEEKERRLNFQKASVTGSRTAQNE